MPQGRYSDAEPLYKRPLAIFEKALGLDHPRVATGLNNLAALYQAQGRYRDAEPLYKRSLTIFEKALGPDHPHVATTLENYAALLQEAGPTDDADKSVRPWLSKLIKMEARAEAIRARHAKENPVN